MFFQNKHVCEKLIHFVLESYRNKHHRLINGDKHRQKELKWINIREDTIHRISIG
jgi:uncharacterized protein YggU (UPF0235/DUF167 family)